MRKDFAKILHKYMKKDKRIFLLYGGVGYGVFDRIIHDFPKRVVNTEAAEITLLNMAIGMTLSGKIVFCYMITPHIYRAFEQIRNYLNHESIPVKLVGVGRNREYGSLGFTHWAEDAQKIFGSFSNIQSFWPNNEVELKNQFDEIINNQKPCFLSLSRT